MFAFTDKPQSLFQLWTHGFNLFKISLPSVWYWSILISVLANFYPILILKGFDMVDGTILHSKLIISVLGWVVLLPIIIFLTLVLIQRLYVTGARKVEKLHRSIILVSKKFIPLFFTIISISFLTTLGLYLIIIPGIFILVLFVFVVPLILIDNKPIWEACKTSAYLVWGNWWRIFAIVLFPLALLILASVFANKFSGFWNYFIAILSTSVLSPLFYSMVLNGFSDAKLRHSMKPLHTRMPKGAK